MAMWSNMMIMLDCSACRGFGSRHSADAGSGLKGYGAERNTRRPRKWQQSGTRFRYCDRTTCIRFRQPGKPGSRSRTIRPDPPRSCSHAGLRRDRRPLHVLPHGVFALGAALLHGWFVSLSMFQATPEARLEPKMAQIITNSEIFPSCCELLLSAPRLRRRYLAEITQ